MKILKNLSYDFKKNKLLLLMILPAVIFFFIFSYLPMSGIVLAFKQLDYAKGIFGSPWVGFNNFKFFFISGQAAIVTRNTVLYNVAFIICSTVSQLLVAIFLSDIKSKWYKKVSQTMMFLPYFISWVVVGAFVYSFFNYEFGTFNILLQKFNIEPIDINGTPWIWKYILVFFNSWKYVGYGSVVFLAGIMGIDQSLYEAASIDGANKFQKIWNITLPSIKSLIIILTLLSIGNIFRGDFGLFYQLVGNNGLLYNATDVIDTFVFRSLMHSQEIGMAAATGVYQSILCFVTLVVTNAVVKKFDEDSALF